VSVNNKHATLTEDDGVMDVEECNITLLSKESLTDRDIHGGVSRISCN